MLRICLTIGAAVGLLGLAVGCKVESTPNSITFSTREDAIKDADKTLKELDAKAAELKLKLDKAAGEEKSKLEAKWKESEGKRAQAAKKVEELKQAADEKWKAVHKETQQAFDEMRKALH